MDSKNKELTALLDLILDAVGVVVDAEKDGKITIEDAGLLLKLVPDLGPAFANVGAVPTEITHLSSADAEALVAHVMGKLALGNAHAIVVISAGLKTAVALLGLVEAIRAVPAPAVAAASPSA